jgi:hypothetical protein
MARKNVARKNVARKNASREKSGSALEHQRPEAARIAAALLSIREDLTT